MKLIRSLLPTTLLIGAMPAGAQLVFKAAFLNVQPALDCYRVAVRVVQPDSTYGTRLVSEAEATSMLEGCDPGRISVSLGTKAGCTPFTWNRTTFVTGEQAPLCFEASVGDEADKAALQAALDYCLGHLNGFKGTAPPVADGLLVYPVPAKQYINIATGFKEVHAAEAAISDATGRQVLRYYIQNPGSDYFTLSLRNFKPGRYVLTVTAGNRELARQTIIVQ